VLRAPRRTMPGSAASASRIRRASWMSLCVRPSMSPTPTASGLEAVRCRSERISPRSCAASYAGATELTLAIVVD
jgi:hypothetical protein